MNCSISIFGGCIARDFFALKENDAGYKIKSLIQWCSPIAAVTKSALLKKLSWDGPEMETAFKGEPGFNRRMAAADLNKTSFQILKETFSDFLMLDASALRYDLLKYELEGGISFSTIVWPKRMEELKNIGVLPKGGEIISITDFPEDKYEFYMGEFVDEILKIYKEEQIIILEFSGSSFYLSNGRIMAFDPQKVKKDTENIDRGTRFFKKSLPKAHIIEFPSGVICDENNKWGKYWFHYIPEYYDYGLEAVNIITESRLTRSEEKEELNALKSSYEKLFKEKYEPVMADSLHYYAEKVDLSSRLSRYTEYFKKLTLNKDCLDRAEKFFKDSHYTRCAFYGLSEVAKFYLELLPEWGIEIDYIVEIYGSDNWKKIPVLSRNLKNYPDTQVMIVADVINLNLVKEKLKNASFPCIDVYELAGIEP